MIAVNIHHQFIWCSTNAATYYQLQCFTLKQCLCITTFNYLMLLYISVLPKVFWAPVLRTSDSWNLPVRMEGSLVRNFNKYYVLLIHVFDGCSNRFDPYDHFNLVCCCLSPVLISDKRSCWKISQSLKPIWLDVEMLIPLSKKKSISAVEMPVKFQSNWKTQRGLAKNCDRTSYVILNQPLNLFSVQQTQVW